MMSRQFTRKLRSTFEEKLVRELDQQSVSFSYESESFPYVTKHKYKPDFFFYQTKVVVEAKGYFTGADRAKTLRALPAIEAAGWELRFVFQKAGNTLTKKSKTTYGAWCNQHGFMWAEGSIPQDWYDPEPYSALREHIERTIINKIGKT